MCQINEGFKFPATFRDLVRTKICYGDRNKAREIAEHGSDCGYAYLTYTYDMLKIYEQYQREIDELLYELFDFGRTPLLDEFNAYARNNGNNDSPHAYIEWCVRVAAETECRVFHDEGES